MGNSKSSGTKWERCQYCGLIMSKEKIGYAIRKDQHWDVFDCLEDYPHAQICSNKPIVEFQRTTKTIALTDSKDVWRYLYNNGVIPENWLWYFHCITSETPNRFPISYRFNEYISYDVDFEAVSGCSTPEWREMYQRIDKFVNDYKDTNVNVYFKIRLGNALISFNTYESISAFLRRLHPLVYPTPLTDKTTEHIAEKPEHQTYYPTAPSLHSTE